MEYLRATFHDELDSDGEIVVAGEVFTRHQILGGLAPEAYRIAFDEWLDQRKGRLLEKADGVLSRYDNADRFEQLKHTYRTSGLTPFVGAGLAMSSGYPSWTAFLYKLREESHVPLNELTTMLKAGQYEEAAEKLSTDLGAALFDENVQATFARPWAANGVINYLPLVFPTSSVFTTNFDHLLESIYKDDKNGGFDHVASGKALLEIGRQLGAGSRILVKFHGDCNLVAERVLLKSEYDAAYGDPKVVEQFFSRVVFKGTLLFLGCSLCVDRTIQAMRLVVATHGAANLPRHYAFMELKASDDRIQRKKDLSKANIFPIWYEENDHDEALEALFIKLLDEK
jgi:hypothetical protein